MIGFSPYLPNVCTLDLGSELRTFASLDNPSLLPIRVIHDLTLLYYPERHSRGSRTLKSRYVCDAPDPEPRSHKSHPVGSVLINVIIAGASVMDHIRMRDISPLPVRVMDAINLQSPQTRLRGQRDMFDEMQYLKRWKFLDFLENNPRLT